ncbi:MAG TPA: solute carrier family 23 protein [Vicinamibacterales bacterium]|jgi:SulP family sulfate permease|nr:solute carrier family 23 protein [Vicinamibacterales bacterium]
MASLASVPLPKLVETLRRGYSLDAFVNDLVAGATVGLVALPLAMAFAIASGVPPQNGIYCAVIAGFLISALGGSSTQIGGPTGAFVVVVAGIVGTYGLDGLFMCTLMAGAILILLGVTGLGTAVKFIPRPVVIGFTNGIGVLIASTQVRDFFGLQLDAVPGDFLGRAKALIAHAGTASDVATALAVATVIAILVLRKISRRIPGSILALLVGSSVAVAAGLPVETIGTRFGGVPSGLPVFHFPGFRPDLILTLLSPAMTVAMLGAIESLLSAVVSDRMSGDRHDPNVELTAQGIANVVSPLFGGLPATGAIARTATNIRSGARTPVAGMAHAVTLLLILLFAAPLARHIPLAILAGILMIVAYDMGEWREIPEVVKLGAAEAAVWLITFALTVFADLTVAVEAGMVLAALLYIRRVTNTTTVALVTPEYIHHGRAHSLQLHDIPDNVAIYRIHGPFLFGATDKLVELEHDVPSLPKVVILRLRNMTAIDGTGLHALEHFADVLHASGRTLILCGMRDQPARMMERAEFHEHIGEANLARTIEAALRRARAVLHEDDGLTPAA